MLGAIIGPEEVGIYSVAMRRAEIVSFLVAPVLLGLSPMVAGLYADKARLGTQGLPS